MFDIGWSEMAVIVVVALFVVGPRDLPKVIRTFGRYAGKIRGMAREFQDSIDEAVREAELDEVKKQIEQAARFDIDKTISNTVDPGGEIGKAMDMTATAKPAAVAPPAQPQGAKGMAAAAAGAAKAANGSGGAPAAGAVKAAEAAPPAPSAPGAEEGGREPDKAGA